MNGCIVGCSNAERMLSTDDIVNDIVFVVVESKPEAESCCKSLRRLVVGIEKESGGRGGDWR